MPHIQHKFGAGYDTVVRFDPTKPVDCPEADVMRRLADVIEKRAKAAAFLQQTEQDEEDLRREMGKEFFKINGEGE